jgi:ribose transport system ATP-binding protein
VALGRWLLTDPSVLILDEPTQGIDVGAKAEIHALMTELAARGVAILMISSELQEVIGMADRIVVLRDGRIAGELPAGAAVDLLLL